MPLISLIGMCYLRRELLTLQPNVKLKLTKGELLTNPTKYSHIVVQLVNLCIVKSIISHAASIVASLLIHQDLIIVLLYYKFFGTCVRLSLSLLFTASSRLSFGYIQMSAGQVIRLPGSQLQAIVSSLVTLLFHGYCTDGIRGSLYISCIPSYSAQVG